MKSLLILAVFLIAAAQETCHRNMKICPSTNNFDAEFSLIADNILPESEPFFFTTAMDFFQDTMKFSNREIEQVTNNAITFFKETYGVDFSKAPAGKNGSRYLKELDVTLFDFQLNPAIGYSLTFNEWTVNGARQSYCTDTRGGGFLVMFGSDTVLHGMYGGIEGRPIRANERIIYGFYNIPLCPQSPLVIQYQSASPIRIDAVDGFAIINLDLFNRELGHGLAQGVFRVTHLGDRKGVHYVIRNLITFPPHPRQREGSDDTDQTMSCDKDKNMCTENTATLYQT